MADFEKAKREVRASVSEDAFAIAELRKWNEMYGEGNINISLLGLSSVLILIPIQTI